MNESASAWARALAARFDGTVLRVEPAQAIEASSAPAAAMRQAAETALAAWCFSGTRFAVATLVQGPVAERAGLVEAFSRRLDGSDQLAAAGGALAGLWLRLRVKGQDAMWWRARQPSDPWDAGYLTGEPSAWRAFRPRRATLVVAEPGLDGAALAEAVQILASNSSRFHQPVRLLVLGRSIDARAWSSTPSSSVAITEITWLSGAASASTASASR
ncbi:hypothetical protein [Hydrogenophaga sp. ANAO-22]|jgi:hypothetical protein|uniref:hypothetical protein n=1 Tax=Hydrogenophaga sp. ANAO-22 TaxID=3166645 RepID=UPI0036D3FFAA